MRSGLWSTTALITLTLGGCGIPQAQYDRQVARAARLEAHLKKKLDRVDYLEAKDKAAQRSTRRFRTGDVARMTRLSKALARVRAALYKKEKALSACRSTRVRVAKPKPVKHSVSGAMKNGRRMGVTLALAEGLLIRAATPGARIPLIRRQLCKGLGQVLPSMTRCAAKVFRKGRGAVQGQLTATLRIDRRGRARGVKVVHKTRSVRRYAKCVRKGLRQLRLHGASAVFMVLPLRLRTNSVSTPRVSTPPCLSARAVHRILKRHQVAIQFCFIRTGLPAKQLRKARVKVAFIVGKSGAPGPVNVVSSVLQNASLNKCIRSKVSKIRFPRSDTATPLMQPEFRWIRPKTKRRRRRRRRKRTRRRR